jgi:hypothetical protein
MPKMATSKPPRPIAREMIVSEEGMFPSCASSGCIRVGRETEWLKKEAVERKTWF